MPTKYKLTYFNARGSAELCRLVFAAADAEYEDYRLKDGEWATLKPKTPLGQLPMLEVDGVAFCQGHSMARYLANQFGLAGNDAIEKFKADIVVDTLIDSTKPVMAFYGEKDEAKKEEMRAKYQNEQLPASLENLQKLLIGNKGGDGFFVGDKLTWSDLAFINSVDFNARQKIEVQWDKFPKLKAHNDRITKLPKVAAWIAKRPQTTM